MAPTSKIDSRTDIAFKTPRSAFKGAFSATRPPKKRAPKRGDKSTSTPETATEKRVPSGAMNAMLSNVVLATIQLAVAYQSPQAKNLDDGQVKPLFNLLEQLSSKYDAHRERCRVKLDQHVELVREVTELYRRFKKDEEYDRDALTDELKFFTWTILGKHCTESQITLLLPPDKTLDGEGPQDHAVKNVGRFLGVAWRLYYSYVKQRRTKFETYFGVPYREQGYFDYVLAILGYNDGERQAAWDALNEFRRKTLQEQQEQEEEG